MPEYIKKVPSFFKRRIGELAETKSGRPSGVTLRAVLTGAVLVGVISVLSPWGILYVKGSQLTSSSIPIISVLFLLLLSGVVVPVLGAIKRRLAFSRSEVITVFSMMLVSAGITVSFTGQFLAILTGAMYYATPENNWDELFVGFQHAWLVPTDWDAVRYFYEGLPKHMAIPWDAWALPLASWMVLMLIIYWVVFCMGVLMRGQWMENERLLFPLMRLPMALIQDGENSRTFFSPLLRNKLMWLGFALPLLLHSWNSLSAYHAAFQRLPLTGSISLLQGQVGVPFRLNFPIIGIAFLMPLNISFSVWFFFVIGVIQRWIFTRIGLEIGAPDIWNSGGGLPAIMHQQAGGMVVLSLFVLWTARSHLRSLWQKALKGNQKGHNEVISPRTAVFGFLVGVFLIVIWLNQTGLSLYVVLLLVLGALIIYIGVARIVSEAGLPGVGSPMVPQAFIIRGFGPDVLGLQNMTALGLTTIWMGGGGVTKVMVSMLHTLKLKATEERADRRLPLVFLVAIVVAMAGSIIYTMNISYAHGGINMHRWFFEGAPKWPFNYRESVINHPEDTFSIRLLFTGIGGSFMALLLFLRQRFLWWPLHPIGFPIATTYTIVSYEWFALFTAWVLKGVILRYGGVRAYRFMVPFFLGLTLGEFFTACMWVFIDGAYGVEGNMIFNF